MSATVLLLAVSNQANAEITNSIQGKIEKEKINSYENSIIIKEDAAKTFQLNNTFKNDLNLMNLYNLDFINGQEARKAIAEIAKQPAQIEKSQEQPTRTIYNIKLSNSGSAPEIQEVQEARIYNENNQPKYDAKYIKESFEQIKKDLVAGKTTEAVALLDKTVSEIKNNAWQFAEAASIYEQLKNIPTALDLYKKAVSLAPTRLEINYSLALCLFKNNSVNEAEKQLSKVLSLKPDFMLAYYNLGSIYYQKGQYYKALENFNKAIKLNPLSADAYFNTAMTLEALDYKTMAIKYYSKSLELNPGDNQSQDALKRLRLTYMPQNTH